MSAAAATPADATVAPAKKGKKKKLIVMVSVVVLLLAVAGGAAVFMLKKKAANAAEGDDATPAASAEAHGSKPDLKHPPTFLPLDPFVVNLADKEADRYAQVGITFEVEDAKFAETMKAFMPALRNGILMTLSHKSSGELLGRAGKEQLAAEILREAAHTMGIEVEAPEPATEPRVDGEKAQAEGDGATPKKTKKKAAAEPNPIKRVHFSNFIVQ